MTAWVGRATALIGVLPVAAALTVVAAGCSLNAGAESRAAHSAATSTRWPTRADRPMPVAQPQPLTTVSADGFRVLQQRWPATGTGPTVAYTIEVAPSLRGAATQLANAVEVAFADRRGWRQTTSLRQVHDPAAAAIRIVLAPPATVDRLCARAGYATGGQYSCWNGQFAALNAMRWRRAAPGFDSLRQYRSYQINHEVGHGLGRGHEYCPGPDATAPVMMQQTKGLLGCHANPWPFPTAEERR